MNCRTVEERIDQILDAPPPKSGGARHFLPDDLAKHLDGCPSCKAQWQLLSAADAALRVPSPVPAPAGMLAEFHRRVELEPLPAAARPARDRRMRWVWGLSGACAAGLAAYGVLMVVPTGPREAVGTQLALRTRETAPNPPPGGGSAEFFHQPTQENAEFKAAMAQRAGAPAAGRSGASPPRAPAGSAPEPAAAVPGAEDPAVLRDGRARGGNYAAAATPRLKATSPGGPGGLKSAEASLDAGTRQPPASGRAPETASDTSAPAAGLRQAPQQARPRGSAFETQTSEASAKDEVAMAARKQSRQSVAAAPLRQDQRAGSQLEPGGVQGAQGGFGGGGLGGGGFGRQNAGSGAPSAAASKPGPQRPAPEGLAQSQPAPTAPTVSLGVAQPLAAQRNRETLSPALTGGLSRPVTVSIPQLSLEMAAVRLAAAAEVTITVAPSPRSTLVSVEAVSAPLWLVLQGIAQRTGLQLRPAGNEIVLVPQEHEGAQAPSGPAGPRGTTGQGVGPATESARRLERSASQNSLYRSGAPRVNGEPARLLVNGVPVQAVLDPRVWPGEWGELPARGFTNFAPPAGEAGSSQAQQGSQRDRQVPTGNNRRVRGGRAQPR